MSEIYTCYLVPGTRRLAPVEAANPSCTDPWRVVRVVGEIASGTEYYGLNGKKELFIIEHYLDNAGHYYEIIEEIPAFLIESEIEGLFEE